MRGKPRKTQLVSPYLITGHVPKGMKIPRRHWLLMPAFACEDGSSDHVHARVDQVELGPSRQCPVATHAVQKSCTKQAIQHEGLSSCPGRHRVEDTRACLLESRSSVQGSGGQAIGG